MTARVPLLAGAALVAATLAAPAAHAACARVRSGNGWTLADIPEESATDTGATVHTLAPTAPLAPANAVPGRYFFQTGTVLYRTTDGCAWQRAYALDPTAPGATDPAAEVVAAHPQYRIASAAAPVAAPGRRPARDAVYLVLTNGDGWLTGAAQNLAGLSPVLVAASTDGGTTWRTDLLRATAPGAPVATPVLGDGILPTTVVASPADPMTAYVSVASMVPEGGPPGTAGRTLYATHDGGVTWAVAGGTGLDDVVVPDVTDKTTLYVQRGQAVAALTTGAKPASRTLLTVPAAETVIGVDTTHPSGQPVRLLVTTRWAPKTGPAHYRVRRSVDAGRTWRAVDVPVSGLDGTFATGGAWLAATGDVVAVRAVQGIGVVVDRWSAARRRWLPTASTHPPMQPGYQNVYLISLVPADTAHRRFAVWAYELKTATDERQVVGVADLG